MALTPKPPHPNKGKKRGPHSEATKAKMSAAIKGEIPPPPPKPKGKAGGHNIGWREEYLDQIYKLCLLGLTNIEIAKIYDIDESTFYEWMKYAPNMRQVLLDGREIADSQVAAKLYHRALGYSHASEKVFYDTKLGEVVRVPIVEHYPPDTSAATFWLANRRTGRGQWARTDKREEEATQDSIKVEGGLPDGEV